MKLRLVLAALLVAAVAFPAPAKAQVDPCHPPPTGSQTADAALAILLQECSLSSAGPLVSPAANEVDRHCAPGGSGVVGFFLWTLQGHNMREACGSAYGSVGYQGIKLCGPSTPIGTIGAVINATREQAKGQPPCDPNVRDQMNATAAAETNATAGAGPSRTLDAFCTASGEGDARRGLCRGLHGVYRVGTLDACTNPQVSQRICPIVLWPVIDDVLP